MKRKISFFGDVLVDLVQKGQGFFPQVGGSIFNTAITVAKKHDTCYISQIGDDYWGKFIIEYCKTNNIDTSNIFLSDKIKTSLAFAIIDKNGNATYDFYKSSDEHIFNPEILTGSFLFHFGSTFSLKPCNKDNIFQFLTFCKNNKIIISYDPNYRNKSSDIELIKQFFTLADIVKLSDEDLSAIFPNKTESDGINYILSNGAKLVILTLGKNGAKAFTKTNFGSAKCNTPTKPITNTIGAGDNFNAGMIDYIANLEQIDLTKLTDKQLTEICIAGNSAALRHLTR